MKRNLRSLISKGNRFYITVFAVFILSALIMAVVEKNNLFFVLSAAEFAALIIMLIYFTISTGRRQKELEAYIDEIAYDSQKAKDNIIQTFPMPISVFMLSDSRIIWGNDMFFSMCGSGAAKFDAKISDIIPNFNAKWMLEKKTEYPGLLTIGGKKYIVRGEIVHTEKDNNNQEAFLGITYWLDVTEYDDVRIEYEQSRPVAGIIIIDNLEELYKNQPDRLKNDIRDSVEDKLFAWVASEKGLIRRYDRDRYIALFEKRDLEKMKKEKFPIIQQMHSVENPSGIGASISLGLGDDGSTFEESLHFADLAAELALTRGGDQAVIKNKLAFDFYGGRGSEIEKRTKVRSRVMATTISELIKDSSRVLIMGHKFSDFDCIGSAAGICCLARKYGVKAQIIVDEKNTASAPLIDMLKEYPEYKNTFISPNDAMGYADSRTLLIIVDTNRPEQIENTNIMAMSSRVAVIDHHRVSSTYVHNAILGFVEPYASSTAELVSEIVQELTEKDDVLKYEAEAILAGIVIDTKNFTIRTGERTFEAAAYLKSLGADTTNVKKMLQMDMNEAFKKYGIMQTARLYKNVAIAAPEGMQNRIIAAQAADELLNISGVTASFVAAVGEDGSVFASARSIGEINVQILCERLGGGGNKSAAAVIFNGIETSAEAVELICQAIDEYLEF